MLIYIGAAVAVVLLALLYHYIPSRKVFFAFFLVLCAASAIIFFLWPTPRHSSDAVVSQEVREERQQQQQVFAVWYTDYQKDLEDLDRNWQRYHKILADFKADIISIQTAYLRLAQLEKDSQALDTRIAGARRHLRSTTSATTSPSSSCARHMPTLTRSTARLL